MLRLAKRLQLIPLTKQDEIACFAVPFLQASTVEEASANLDYFFTKIEQVKRLQPEWSGTVDVISHCLERYHLELEETLAKHGDEAASWVTRILVNFWRNELGPFLSSTSLRTKRSPREERKQIRLGRILRMLYRDTQTYESYIEAPKQRNSPSEAQLRIDQIKSQRQAQAESAVIQPYNTQHSPSSALLPSADGESAPPYKA